jgi:outer membrane usher protein
LTGTPIAAAQSNAGGAVLSQAQKHSRVIARFLLRCASATALLHTLQVAAQSVPAGRRDEGITLQKALILTVGMPPAPSAVTPAARDNKPVRLRLIAELAAPRTRPLDTPSERGADQPTEAVINLRLNGVAKGDFVVYVTADRDFLLPVRDLIEMGVPRAAGRTVDIAGESHLALKSIAGAELNFNEKTLTLDLQLPPGMLPGQRLNLGATLPATPIQRRAPGGFLNYRLGYSHTQGGFDSYNVTTELGLNVGKFLFLDNRVFNTPTDQQRAVRLQTQLVYDQPEELRRWVLGDSFASSGELGSSLNLGGVSLSKLYQINPYFIKTPLAAFAGAVTLPSTVDIYMDGARVRSEKIAPGNFNLQNLNSYSATGLRNVEVVIKDAFGREERIGFPYFFTDQLLSKGLHEYSYNAGFIRNNFGVTSDDYGTAAVSAFHRYGLSDALTVGLGGDATRDHINFGPRVSLNTVKAGVVTAGLSLSHDSDFSTRSGAAASANHTFLSGPFSSQILLRRFSEDYSVIGVTPDGKPKLQASASVNYGNRIAGTYSLSYAVQTVFGGATDQHTTTLGYTKTLGQNVSLAANVSRVVQGSSGYAVFFGISYFPGNGLSVNASHEKTKDGDSASQLQFAKAVPIGEGVGYRVIAQRSVTAGAVSESISPFVQYNARNAMLSAEGTNFVNGGSGSSSFYQLSLAGAAAYIGNDVYFSRPINDSFGLVKIEPPLAGVRVLKSNAEIGITGASGAVFVPSLGSYQVNEVAIQSKDIPMDYTVAQTVQKLRPPLRSGVLGLFPVTRIRAVTGSLKLRSDGAVTPIENYEVVLTGVAASARVSTIRNGDFYLENLAPGRYSAQLKVEEKTCRLELTVPDNLEIVANLGDIFCETVH